MRHGRLFGWRQAEKDIAGEMDTTVPYSARLWDCWLGGKDNFLVGQEANDNVLARLEGIMGAVRRMCYFIARAVRQFLDVSTGLPFLYCHPAGGRGKGGAHGTDRG